MYKPIQKGLMYIAVTLGVLSGPNAEAGILGDIGNALSNGGNAVVLYFTGQPPIDKRLEEEGILPTIANVPGRVVNNDINAAVYLGVGTPAAAVKEAASYVDATLKGDVVGDNVLKYPAAVGAGVAGLAVGIGGHAAKGLEGLVNWIDNPLDLIATMGANVAVANHFRGGNTDGGEGGGAGAGVSGIGGG